MKTEEDTGIREGHVQTGPHMSPLNSKMFCLCQANSSLGSLFIRVPIFRCHLQTSFSFFVFGWGVFVFSSPTK